MYTEMAVESDDSVSDIIRAAASSLGTQKYDSFKRLP